MTDTSMHCPSRDDLSAFHDGELVAPERARVERHLTSCADCAKALARMQRASGLLSALPRDEASAELVRDVAQKAAGRRGPAKWHLMALPLASAAAMLALSFLLLRMTREQTMSELAPAALGARVHDAKRGAETGSANDAGVSAADSPAASAPLLLEGTAGKKEQSPGAMMEDKLAQVDEQAATSNEAPLRRPESQAAERAKQDTRKDADSESEQDARAEKPVARADSAFAPEPPAELASTAQRQAAPATAAAPAPAPAAPAPMAKTRAAGETTAAAEESVSGGAVGGVIGGVVGSVVGRGQGSDIQQQPASPSTPITIGPGVTPPLLVKRVEPDVPRRRDEIEREIVLSCVVDERGSIRVEMVLTGSPERDQAAIAAVNQWIYQPAIFEGHPQAVYLVVRLRWPPPER